MAEVEVPFGRIAVEVVVNHRGYAQRVGGEGRAWLRRDEVGEVGGGCEKEGAGSDGVA